MQENLIYNIRSAFDFQYIPSFVFSDDCEDFVIALIKSEGQVLAEIMSDFFVAMFKEEGIEVKKNPIFTKEQFNIISGSVDADTLMVIVVLPPTHSDITTASLYSIVYYANNQCARLFEVASRGDNSILCEMQKDTGPINLGDIAAEPRALMNRVLEIIK